MSLVQGCCWLWPLAREKLLGWGLGRSPGLKTVSSGLQPRGTRGRRGKLAEGQAPSGDLSLFLNPFLPLLARSGCQERQGKQWVGPGDRAVQIMI